MRTPPRSSDPFSPARRDVLTRLDVDTQVELRDRDTDAITRTPDQTRILVCTTLWWYHEAIPANAATTLRQPQPTGATAWGSISGQQWRCPAAGRVVRAMLWLDGAGVGAGSVWVRVRVADGSGSNTDYDLADTLITTGGSRGPCAMSWANGIPYDAGGKVIPLIVTDAAWNATTVNGTVTLVLCDEEYAS